MKKRHSTLLIASICSLLSLLSVMATTDDDTHDFWSSFEAPEVDQLHHSLHHGIAPVDSEAAASYLQATRQQFEGLEVIRKIQFQAPPDDESRCAGWGALLIELCTFWLQ